MCYTEISDETWQRLEPVLPLEGSPKGGRPAKDKRTFINAIIWLLRTGAPWRALPEEYGSWNAVYSRFRRWQIKGSWKAVFLALASDPDLEAVMIDGTYRSVPIVWTVSSCFLACLFPHHAAFNSPSW